MLEPCSRAVDRGLRWRRHHHHLIEGHRLRALVELSPRRLESGEQLVLRQLDRRRVAKPRLYEHLLHLLDANVAAAHVSVFGESEALAGKYLLERRLPPHLLDHPVDLLAHALLDEIVVHDDERVACRLLRDQNGAHELVEHFTHQLLELGPGLQVREALHHQDALDRLHYLGLEDDGVADNRDDAVYDVVVGRSLRFGGPWKESQPQKVGNHFFRHGPS